MTSRYEVRITETGKLFCIDSLSDVQDIVEGAEAEGNTAEAFVVTGGWGSPRRRINI